MAQLRLDYQKFRALDAEIIAIGPEQPDEFRAFWEREQMPFAGCADSAHHVADLFGQEVHLLKLGRMPALFIIDKKGIIQYIHKAKSMSDIPSNKEVLSVLASLKGEK